MEQKPFSAWRAMENDFSLTTRMMIPIFAWALYLFPLVLFGGSRFLFYLVLAATVLGPALMAWRLFAIRRVFQQGQVVPGVIRGAQFLKDRGRINFNYTYLGQDYPGTVVVHANDRTRAFQDDQQVELVIDPDKPKQAYLRGLYT